MDVRNIIILNGVYDIVCGVMFIIPLKYQVPILNRLHKDMIKVNSKINIEYMGYWILSYGVMRIYDKKIAGYSYLIECICFLNEIYHERIYLYKGLYVCLSSFCLFICCINS